MDKPFKTIDAQLDILTQRGVIIDSNNAGDILLREGYYSVINGYKDLFLSKKSDNASDIYKDGTRFSEIYRLFVFDRSLRMLLFRYLSMAEATLKTVSSYHFAEEHQPHHYAYLCPTSYDRDERKQKFIGALISDFKATLEISPNKMPKSQKDYIKHYLGKDREVPIWVLMNYLNFGQVTKFYSFQKEFIKFRIASTFEELHKSDRGYKRQITHKNLQSAYEHMKDMRNICAHDERLYCARVAPKRNVTFAHLLDDLSLILPQEYDYLLRKEVIAEVTACKQEIRTISKKQLLRRMGLASIDQLFYAVG